MTGHPARRRLGQHFLHDPRIVEAIVAALAPRPEDHLVEIGPGTGALTRALIARVASLDAIEIDPRLAAGLQAACSESRHVTVHHADALRFDICRLAPSGRRLRVIGNLPYSVSTPLLFHLLEHASCIEDMLFMLQREVVARLAAAPGGKDYGRLSVMLQWRCRVERLFDVGPGAFSPPPRVDSALVRLVPYGPPLLDVGEPRHFAEVVRAAFAARRKTLRNALRDRVNAETLRALGIDPARRAETLSLAEFAAVARAAHIA